MVGIGKRLLATTLVLALGLLLLPLNSFAASTGQIKGKIVHGESGEPVIGASVLVVGTTQGAMTDLEGEFQIYLHKGEEVTIYSSGKRPEMIIKPLPAQPGRSNCFGLNY